MAMPGEDIKMNLKLNKQMTIKAGQQFTIRSAGVTVGSGKVSYCHLIYKHSSEVITFCLFITSSF